MDALRKIYHRAVQIPLENVQKLWEELETFEMSLNKITAKKFMADLSPSHTQARQVLRELKNNYMKDLQLPPPVPPSIIGQANAGGPLYLPSRPRYDSEELQLIRKWKDYLRYEEGNPLVIEDKDKNIFISRVTGVYRKAVIRMRYYPEIW
jgi:cleavage stimulation factor subunit 3